MQRLRVTKLSGLEAIQDGKDHVSLKPSQDYLDKTGMDMKEALEDWAKGGDEHSLSQELAKACK